MKKNKSNILTINYENKNIEIVIPNIPKDKIMGSYFNKIKYVVNTNSNYFESYKQNKLTVRNRITIIDNKISYSNPQDEIFYKSIILQRNTKSISVANVSGQILLLETVILH